MDAGPAEADERVALTDTAREHTAQTRLTGRYIPRPVLTKAGRAPYICDRYVAGGWVKESRHDNACIVYGADATVCVVHSMQ